MKLLKEPGNATAVRRKYSSYDGRYTLVNVGSRSKERDLLIRGIPGTLPPMKKVLARDNLVNALKIIQAEKGDAAGIDGIRPSHLSTSIAGPILESMGYEVIHGVYRPGPARIIEIAKANGGVRTLRIPNVFDRVLLYAMYHAIAPTLDCLFSPSSYGFRPRRSPLHLLAALQRRIEETGQTFLVLDDIEKAFDNVRLADLEADIQRLMGSAEYVEHIMVMARADDPNKEIGIPQGSALAPLLLLVHLHCRHDALLYGERNENIAFDGWYADNRVILAADAMSGEHRLQHSRMLIESVGLRLKGTPGYVIDFRRDQTTASIDTEPQTRPDEESLLGFHISMRGDNVRYRLSNRSWACLDTAITDCLETADPRLDARITITGWLSQAAPMLTTHADEATRRMFNILRHHGFEHTLTRAELRSHTDAAISRWGKILEDLNHTDDTQHLDSLGCTDPWDIVHQNN